MDVDKLAIDLLLKGMTQEQQKAALESIKDSVTQAKAIQKQRIGENVQVVIQALKKIESDIKDKYDGVTTVIEKRVASIKDGKDGRNGADGKAGKDGRPGRDGAVGPRGADGLNGRDGKDGENGVSVTDAYIDFDGSLIIRLSSGQTLNVGEVVAPDIAEKIKVITNGGGTSQSVLDTLTSLQDQINALVSMGSVNYVGTWNASTNTPTIVAGTGDKGDYYVVSVAGSTNIDGQSLWGVGDWIIFNGTAWQKVDGGSTGDLTTLTVTGNTTLGDASTDTVTVSGRMGVGGAATASMSVYARSTALTGSGQGGFYADIIGSSAATSEISGFRSSIRTEAAAFTVADLSHFRAFNATKGAGSTITNQHGLYIADQTQGTNNYGITSLVSSGANKFNIYASGTAQNYFGGNVGIGTTTPANKLNLSDANEGTHDLAFNRNTTYGASTGLGGISWYNQVGDTRLTRIDSQTDGAATNARIIFSTASSGTLAERMRLDSAGNVGIGTTAPGSKLDVKGTLRLSGATSGYVGLAPAAAAGSTTYTLPAADGTAGQVLSTNGAATLSWATASGGGGGITSGTAVTTTSGTVVDFTGIPAGTKCITVMFNGVSTTGTSQPYLQLGTSGGIEITGYESGIGAISATANTTNGSISVTAAFPLYHGAIVAPAVISGNLTVANLSGNIWTVSGTVLSGNRAVMLGGVKTLAAALTQIRLTTAGGVDTFDAGSMNIMYQ